MSLSLWFGSATNGTVVPFLASFAPIQNALGPSQVSFASSLSLRHGNELPVAGNSNVLQCSNLCQAPEKEQCSLGSQLSARIVQQRFHRQFAGTSVCGWRLGTCRLFVPVGLCASKPGPFYSFHPCSAQHLRMKDLSRRCGIHAAVEGASAGCCCAWQSKTHPKLLLQRSRVATRGRDCISTSTRGRLTRLCAATLSSFVALIDCRRSFALVLSFLLPLCAGARVRRVGIRHQRLKQAVPPLSGSFSTRCACASTQAFSRFA